jgi:hypothetical protein
VAQTEIIDAYVYHHWATDADVVRYLPEGGPSYFRADHMTPNRKTPASANVPRSRYPNPSAEMRGEANGLCHQPGLGLPGIPNTRLNKELTRAANDYTLKRWVEATYVFTLRGTSGGDRELV